MVVMRHFDSHRIGVTHVLMFSTLCFIGIVTYVLVITHHLKIDHQGLHLQAHPNQAGVQPRPVGSQDQLAPVTQDVADAFANRILDSGLFKRYDKDGNGQLSVDEYKVMTRDMATARIISTEALHLFDKVARPMLSSQVGTSPAPSVATPQPVAAPATATASSPEGSCPELSKEQVASLAVNNTIMLTVSDWKIFQTFGKSWMKHLARIGVTYYLVGATDKQTSAFLGGLGNHPCFKFFEDGHGHGNQNAYQYGDGHYNAATWRKVVLVTQIVEMGFNVIHSDVDVVWFRNPLPYFLGPHLEQTDVAVSTDLVSTENVKGDAGLEAHVHENVNVNTGVYFVKSSPGGLTFMKEWLAQKEEGLKRGIHDQFGLYGWLRSGRVLYTNRTGRYIQLKADQAGLPPARLSLLGVHMLLNGYSYFIPQLNKLKEVDALGVHLTWVPLSREGKFSRMRDGQLYNDAPEYYEGPDFITAELDLPSTPDNYNTLLPPGKRGAYLPNDTSVWDTERMIKFHLQAMDTQLTQVYRVWAIAFSLNRTLILPKMRCFCYKNWFMMEQCRIPGDSATLFPLTCALDQWLRPKVVYNYGPLEGAGGLYPVQVREHSLLENINFPRHLLPNQVVVQSGDVSRPEVATVASTSLGPAFNGLNVKVKVVTLPKHMQQDKLMAAIKLHAAGAKIIRLRGAKDLFGGWDDQKLKGSYEAFVDKAAGNWCCRDRPFIDNMGLKEKEKLVIHW